MAEALGLDSDRDSDACDSDSEEEVECLMELNDCTVSLAQVLNGILEEGLVNKASMGASICTVVNKCLLQIGSREMKQFGSVIMREIQQCFPDKGKIKLSTVWRKFHILRLSPSIMSVWKLCVPPAEPNTTQVSNIVLQVIIKRMFSDVIQQMTTAKSSASLPVQLLSVREENVVRYVAGYVVYKLRKRYSECSAFFRSVQSSFEDIHFQTLQDYTKSWTEQVDRGGLCHVNDNFFKLLKEVEYVARKYLDTRIAPGNDLMCKITTDSINSHHIKQLWDEVSCSITDEGRKYDILKYIVSLWCNIRVHSFAERWTDKLANNKGHTTKAIRKTLKDRGTEKESM
jgi:hypothetical protein